MIEQNVPQQHKVEAVGCRDWAKLAVGNDYYCLSYKDWVEWVDRIDGDQGKGVNHKDWDRVGED